MKKFWLMLTAAVAAALVSLSCSTAEKQDKTEYWTTTKKVYFDANKLMSGREEIKAAAIGQYAELLPDSKEAVNVYLAGSLRFAADAKESEKITSTLKELKAGAEVIPGLIESCAVNPAAEAAAMPYLSDFNPADYNKGKIGSLIYSDDKKTRILAAEVLSKAGSAAASALPDIFKLAYEKDLSYGEYSRVMDAARGISEKIARTRMMLDIASEDRIKRELALKKLIEIMKKEKPESASYLQSVKAVEGAMYHADDEYALALKSVLKNLPGAAAAEAVKSYDGINAIQTYSMKDLAMEKMHRRFAEEAENMRLTLYVYYNSAGRPDAAKAVMREK